VPLHKGSPSGNPWNSDSHACSAAQIQSQQETVNTTQQPGPSKIFFLKKKPSKISTKPKRKEKKTELINNQAMIKNPYDSETL